YPIALNVSAVTNGVSSPGVTTGNFGWLNWDGKSPSEEDLAVSLTPPGNSYTYNYEGDRILSIGDFVYGSPGAKRSSNVQAKLDYLINNGIIITVPVWSETPQGQGSRYKYKVASYENIVLAGYDFSNGGNTIYFSDMGPVSCNAVSTQPP